MLDGGAAFLMEENGRPVAPAILGIVLGPMIENNIFSCTITAIGTVPPFISRLIAVTARRRTGAP